MRAQASPSVPACESALRSTLVHRGSHLPATASASQWVQLAASNGLVMPDEERRLHRFAQLRNRLAHGLRPSSEPDPTDVPFVLAIARRVLGDVEESHPGAE